MGNKQSTLIESLLKQEAYPHSVTRIELLETHISWVILTGPFAYKIKKAVQLDFLDFSTLERRRYFCEEELRLNQRWAPELYLEVLPICGSAERPAIGGDGIAIEYALKMVQFPQSAQLDNQLAAGLLHEDDMLALAETIAGYHRAAKRLDYTAEEESIRQVRAPILDNFPPVARVTNLDILQSLQGWTEKTLHDLEPELVHRRKSGFVRECHGDLHLANLVRLPNGVAAFDCIEFSTELRNIDVISDVAFLVMDLVARARQDLAYVLINRYLECTGDYSGMAVFGLYFVYHCMIRAKVAAIRSTERAEATGRGHDIHGLKHNLVVAFRWIEQPGPRLIAMHGYSASGKTWISSQLMSRLPAIRVRSDIERKRIFGLDETTSSHSKPGQGIYSKRARAGVYESLIETAERLLEAGFDVIIDASFLRQTDRRRVAALASRQSVSLVFVDTKADNAELLRRLQNRKNYGKEISEADKEVLQHQYNNSDPLNAAERKRTVFVATDADVDPDHIIKSIRAIYSPGKQA